MEICGNVELGNGIYWIGICEYINELHCNPYLIIDNDEAILVDPGSVLDFEAVFTNVTELVPLDNITHVIVHHQDPDLCASLPLFEKAGLKAKIVTHWRSSLLIKYYGISSEFYIVNENGHSLTLRSGRTINFIDTPYLHFPGAIATYDTQSKTLFSGDLFGSISEKWELFADDNYIEAMKGFHEHYAPGNDIIRPVMELFMGIDIKTICPQHGSIIQKDIKKMIAILRDLECGVFMHPIKRQLAKTGGYISVCNQIMKRLISIYGQALVVKTFSGTPLKVNKETGILENCLVSENELWNRFFSIVYSNGGVRWLTVIEPLVKKLTIEYGLEIPEVYRSSTIDVQKEADKLKDRYQTLYSVHSELKRKVEQTSYILTKDSLTDLYNESFFTGYMIKLFEEQEGVYTVLFVGIDYMKSINQKYGEDKGDEVIKTCAYLLMNEKKDNHYVFRLKGPIFALLISQIEGEKPLQFADKLCSTIKNSELFIAPITVSVSTVLLDHSIQGIKKGEELSSFIIESGRIALEKAQKEGGNKVVSSLYTQKDLQTVGKVLILEYDIFHAQLLKEALETLSLTVRICSQGSDAVEIAETFLPDVIIAEKHLSQVDVFIIRETLMEKTATKHIPLIIVSHQKDEQSVARAVNLGITHYLKKPYMMPELIGITDNLIKIRKEFN